MTSVLTLMLAAVTVTLMWDSLTPVTFDTARMYAALSKLDSSPATVMVKDTT